jgi:hypothetical protein
MTCTHYMLIEINHITVCTAMDELKPIYTVESNMIHKKTKGVTNLMHGSVMARPKYLSRKRTKYTRVKIHYHTTPGL